MRAIAVTCPQCGATLRVEGDVASVTCSYCGTVSRIQQRSRVFQVPRPMPPPGPSMPPVVARQKVSPAAFAVPIVVAMAAVGGGAFFASRAAGVAQRTAQHVEQATQGTPQAIAAAAAKQKAGWWGETPILIDADGDGADDLVGVVRYVEDNDRAHLAAYSAKTGAQLWETPQLGTGANLTQAILGKAGDVVLMATEDGMLQTFDRRDGAARLKMSMGEKVQAMCAAAAGEVVILTADDRWTRVDVAGKQHVSKPLVRLDRPGSKPKDALNRFRAIGVEVPPGLCVPADNNHWQKPAVLLSLDSWSRLPELPGMSISLLVRHPGGPIAAIGSKRPGTAVPMLARLDGDKARWTAEVPASDPLTARADERAVGMSATAIYAVYSLSNPSRERLAAFSLEDGRRLWDQPIEHGSGLLNVTGVVATGDVVLVVAWSAVQAFDQQDGTTRFAIGSL